VARGESLRRFERVAGHPLAFLATAAALLTLFGWTFLANPDRVAPTKDPAYYTWRTETLISESPVDLLDIEGAFDMFSGGFRVSAPVIGGFLRQVGGVSVLNQTVVLMVAIPVLTALLLAGFVYRNRRDPLAFHVVAFGVASLYLTPPFVGYLDNVLCLLWLAAAVWFIGPARDSLAGRAGLFLFLLLAGLTHPTTLVFFCLTLAAIGFVHLLFRRFDLRSVIRDDGPMLVTAFLAALATFAVWTIGIWGRSASLTEAALPPPYDSDFFLERMTDWVGVMNPVLNGPLFAVGVVGLLAAGRRWAEDDVGAIAIVWLVPLAGLFGFVGGLTYPYYRFFNTTLAWVLLVGIGAYFFIRMVANRARGGSAAPLGAVAVIVVGVVFIANFSKGFDSAGWNDPGKGWLSADEKRDLDSLRATLSGDDTPVVFLLDSADDSFQVWGETKLVGNTSRYGLPHGQIDQGYLYLGSLDNFVAGRPTFRGDRGTGPEECEVTLLGEATYNCLSKALLADAEAGIERAGREPIVVVASAFNPAGVNAEIARGDRDLVPAASEAEVLAVHEGEVTSVGTGAPTATENGVAGPARGEPESNGGIVHLIRVLICLAIMLIPGALAVRWFTPRATFGEALAMVPVLSLALLTVTGVIVLALVRSPLSPVLAWTSVVACTGATAVVAARSEAGFRLRGLRPQTSP
jgi:hypothetical protein